MAASTVNRRMTALARRRQTLLNENARARSRGTGVHPAKTSKVDFIRAMAGSHGVKKRIAERLKVTRGTVDDLLERPDWSDVRELYFEELKTRTDYAEDRLMRSIVQEDDPVLATKAATWLLERTMAETYGKRVIQTTVHEGGQNPIRHIGIQIPVEALDKPVEVQRELLKSLDQHEQRQIEAEKRKLVAAKVVDDGNT